MVDVTCLDQIAAKQIHLYLVELHRRKLSGLSQYSAARAIKTFPNFCIHDKFDSRVANGKVKMRGSEQRPIYAFATTDIEKLLYAYETE